MRKILICILLMLSFASIANAETEINIFGIPWCADENTVFDILKKEGIVREDYTISTFLNGNATYLIQQESGLVIPHRNLELDEVCYSLDLLGELKGKIAGWPLRDMTLSFAYNGDYQLIAVKIELINAKYDELKEKLTKKYGEGLSVITDEMIESIVWKNSNNSCILLYSQSQGLDYTLMYGRLDAAEILQNCLAPADPDDVSGL